MIHPALRQRQRWVVCSLLALIAVTAVIGMGWGYSSLSYGRLLPTLLGHGTFKEEFVLYSIRLPRMLITLLAGMALALSGAILQRTTRNDLADPGIIGIHSGAGVGVAIFFLTMPLKPDSSVYLLPLAAFLGALSTACVIYVLAYKKNEGLQPIRFVLTGVGFSMALSGITVVLISSAEREKVDFIAKWLVGNVWGTDWVFIGTLLPWLVVLIPYAFYKASQLNILGLSEPAAIGVGLSIQTERISLMITAVALAASAVSATGGISFIGLMAPHIARALVGPRNQLSLPVALLMGGWLLLVSDTIGRNLVDPYGIPAGIMVAFIGAPYFLYLLLKK
ncbi:FecCD family ABC transporter permease [Brevibacillus massiliensis]|jgi:iron complex transport system permease protein|uniref:FecCD family ABC transporter permease n=1 Tax=Brevibacillus massiliensis TaxID=1118054 RepID=UPI000318F709|nr:iron ABC transporter permease [Brevibacillus massiliensis]